MAEESTLPVSSAPDFSDRVDALLSSALAEQAREKRQLVDTLYGAKAALVKAEEELAALREQMAKRDEELLDAVDQKLEARFGALEEALLKIARSVTGVPAKVRGDIEVAAVAIGDRMGDECDALLRNLREDAVEVVATMSKLSDRNVAQTQNAIEAAREEYRTTTEQVVNYLGQRDDALQRQRDQVLVDLFRQLGESLGKRNAKKVGKAIASDPEIGRRPEPSLRPGAAPPPVRQPPVYRSPGAGSQLGQGSSIVTPPPHEAPHFAASAPEGEPTGVFESQPEYPAEPSQAPDISERGPAVVPVSPFDASRPDRSAGAAGMFGPIMPDEESKSRKTRRKAKDELAGPPKPPPKRVIRRKPPS